MDQGGPSVTLQPPMFDPGGTNSVNLECGSMDISVSLAPGVEGTGTQAASTEAAAANGLTPPEVSQLFQVLAGVIERQPAFLQALQQFVARFMPPTQEAANDQPQPKQKDPRHYPRTRCNNDRSRSPRRPTTDDREAKSYQETQQMEDGGRLTPAHSIPQDGGRPPRADAPSCSNCTSQNLTPCQSVPSAPFTATSVCQTDDDQEWPLPGTSSRKRKRNPPPMKNDDESMPRLLPVETVVLRSVRKKEVGAFTAKKSARLLNVPASTLRQKLEKPAIASNALSITTKDPALTEKLMQIREIRKGDEANTFQPYKALTRNQCRGVIHLRGQDNQVTSEQLQVDIASYAAVTMGTFQSSVPQAYPPQRTDMAMQVLQLQYDGFARVEKQLAELTAAIHKLKDKRTILAGDFNARHSAWGYANKNARDKNIKKACVAAGLELCNDPDTPTRLAQAMNRNDTSPDLTWIGVMRAPAASELAVLPGPLSLHLYSLVQATPSTGAFHPMQTGFRPYLSTQYSLLMIHHDLYERRLFKSQPRTLVAIDLPNAFDSIPHSTIVSAAKRRGVQGRLLNFIKTFLQDRTFQVSTGQTKGQWRTNNIGVPQGAVLSPLLFNLAMVDLALAREAVPEIRFTIYADDVTLWTTAGGAKSQQNNMQRALNIVTTFALKSGLELSKEKTTYMVIPCRRRSARTDIELRLDGIATTPTNSVKILGVTFETKGGAVTWLRQVKSQWKDGIELLKAISSKAWGAQEDLRRRLVVYGLNYLRLTKNQEMTLVTIMRAAMRVVTGLPRFTPVDQLERIPQMNTIREIFDEMRISQACRLSRTPHGRIILTSSGRPHLIEGPLIPTPTPPWNVEVVTPVKPLPSHQGLENHGRRATQAAIHRSEISKLAAHVEVFYTDAARDNSDRTAIAWHSPTCNETSHQLASHTKGTCTAELFAIMFAAGARQPIIIAWIPGHADIPGNERADGAARALLQILCFPEHGPSQPVQLPVPAPATIFRKDTPFLDNEDFDSSRKADFRGLPLVDPRHSSAVALPSTTASAITTKDRTFRQFTHGLGNNRGAMTAKLLLFVIQPGAALPATPKRFFKKHKRGKEKHGVWYEPYPYTRCKVGPEDVSAALEYFTKDKLQCSRQGLNQDVIFVMLDGEKMFVSKRFLTRSIREAFVYTKTSILIPALG
ncbi:hypothetical protein HPB47_000397 [Ixodes persulcatus]|uniref:Uncharacterized protein n=1 Tax=Ixodes persulcatus TaxID=34615 RepID=A0AC60PRX3_IXOPE|nr:hypothetical protein HPB47_000397 [Ixodes persulcatus]